MVKKRSELDYAFSLGKVRAMERFLFSQELFEEALGSELSEALRLFAESELYSDELMHVTTGQKLENILQKELITLKGTIAALVLDKELLFFLDIDSLTRACLACRCFNSPFLSDYLMSLVDMHNIKTFLRLYVLQEPIELLDEKITCEGFIPKKDFVNLYNKELAAFLNRLEYVHKRTETIDYTYHLGQAIKNVVKKRSFVALEKAMQDLLMQGLKPAKYFTFGPEAVLAYYFARVNEINLIRLIILAKINNLPKERIVERLNTVYA